MKDNNIVIEKNIAASGSLLDYIQVLKPRESSLLVYIGLGSALVAGNGFVATGTLVLTILTVLIASAAANGLTNYLDRDLDARMPRTQNRALAAGRIYPAEKALPMLISLTVIGFILAWVLHPYCFLADLVGTLAAVIWRKRFTCVFPQGMLASIAPVLIGWLAVSPEFSWALVWLCLLIAFWLPSHIWSIMIANRNEYLGAGLSFFPFNREPKSVVWILVIFCLLMWGASWGLYISGQFGWLYLAVANVLGIVMLYGSLRFAISGVSRDAWKIYKLSAFPYLGILFLAICLDIWFL